MSKSFNSRIRIEKIKLENFKGVKKGEVELNNKNASNNSFGHADILGLYGQNGSGKTTLLEALSIVKKLMIGERLSQTQMSNLISQGSEVANVSVFFQISNEDTSFYNVEYKFEIAKEINKELRNAVMHGTDHALKSSVLAGGVAATAATAIAAPVVFPVVAGLGAASIVGNAIAKKSGSKRIRRKDDIVFERMVVRNESLSLSGEFHGEIIRFGPIFDTNSNEEPFLPKAKQKVFFPDNTSLAMKELNKYKANAKRNSKSFIFCDELSSMLIETVSDKQSNDYIDLLFILKAYAIQNLRVLDSRAPYDRKGEIIRLFTANRGVSIHKDDSSTFLDEEGLNTLRVALSSLNIVLNHLIPGMSLIAVEQVDKDLKENREIKNKIGGTKVIIYSERNDVRIPLGEESAGIQKLISMLGLFAYAFVNESVTVAIDEIDAGVYEYLLGELLIIFEEYGQGQLIFTCHNLRPMEVINRKSIFFTTTNKDNRYIKPKNIRAENNLRDVYLREIKQGGQDEELYNDSKQGKIVAALQKAGDIIGQD